MHKILDFLQDNWQVIAGTGGIVEVILRLVPTHKNLSIIDNAVKILGFLIKNRRKPSPNDVMAGPEKNTMVVDVKKHVI